MNKESLLTRILKSVFFKKAQGQAGKYVGNSEKLVDLAKAVFQKLQSVGFKGNLSEFQKSVQLLIRLVRAYASGRYKDLSVKSLLSIVAVLIYFLSPIDLVPDFLPVIGIADDIALVVWLMNLLGDEINKFSEWEKNDNTINIG
jgi:uncharacterized membrane protein YkvA (DUF1232 family)